MPTQAFTTTGSQNWNWPVGVTSAVAEAVGGGGGGGTASGNPASGGGGRGGNYAKATITKGAETLLVVVVGTGGAIAGAGAASTVTQNAVLRVAALGGGGGATQATSSANGAGATVAGAGTATGTTLFTGGNGGTGNFTSGTQGSGAGGGAAGPTANGGAASVNVAGTANTANWADGASHSGAGAAGVGNSTPGITGPIYGGGASGGKASTGADQNGGVGAQGYVLISWTAPDQAVTGVTLAVGSVVNVPVVANTQLVTGEHRATTQALNVPVVTTTTFVTGVTRATTVSLNVPTIAPGPVTISGVTCATTAVLNVPTVSFPSTGGTETPVITWETGALGDPIGPGFTVIQGDFYQNYTHRLLGNGGTLAWAIALWTDDTFPPEQWVEADLYSGYGVYAGLLLNCDSTALTGYLVHYTYTGADWLLTLYHFSDRIVSVFTLLAQVFAPANTVKARLERIGNDLILSANGTVIATVTDTTYAGAYAGIGTYTSAEIDNWQAGSGAPAGPSTQTIVGPSRSTTAVLHGPSSVALATGTQTVTAQTVYSTVRMSYTESLMQENDFSNGVTGLSRAGLNYSQVVDFVGGNLTSIALPMYGIGSPADQVYVDIRVGGVTGSLIAASLKASIPMTETWVSFAFPGGVNLSLGVTYYIGIYRTTPVDDPDNRYNLGISAGDAYANGDLLNYDGSIYLTGVDARFRLYTGVSHKVELLNQQIVGGTVPYARHFPEAALFTNQPSAPASANFSVPGYSLGQSFSGHSGLCSAMSFLLHALAPSMAPPGGLYLEMRTGSATGTMVAQSYLVPISALPSAPTPAEIIFQWATPITLSAGTTYYVRMQLTVGASCTVWGSNVNPYAGGTALDAAGAAITGSDLNFTLYTQVSHTVTLLVPSDQAVTTSHRLSTAVLNPLTVNGGTLSILLPTITGADGDLLQEDGNDLLLEDGSFLLLEARVGLARTFAPSVSAPATQTISLPFFVLNRQPPYEFHDDIAFLYDGSYSTSGNPGVQGGLWFQDHITGPFTKILLQVQRIGTATDGVYLSLNAGSFNGPVLAVSNTIPFSALTAVAIFDQEFVFPTWPVLAAGVKYYVQITFTRTGTQSGTLLIGSWSAGATNASAFNASGTNISGVLTSTIYVAGSHTVSLELPVTGTTITSTLVMRVPTVVAGPVTITGVHRATTIQVFAPTVIGLVTGVTIPSGSGVFAPSVAQTVVGVHRATTVQTFIPSITTTTVVALPANPTTIQVFAPTVVPGPVTITGATIATTVIVRVPTVTTGPVTITGATLPTAIAVTPPAIAVGPVSVTGVTIASTLVVRVPSVVPGPVSITGATLATSIGVTAPSIAVGPVTLVGATLVTGSLVFPPKTTALVTGPFIPSGSGAFPPSVAQSVTTQNLTSTGVLFAPSVTQTVTTVFRDSTAVVYPATITTGPVGITTGTRPTTLQLTAPTVAPGPVTLVGVSLVSTVQCFAAAITTGAVSLVGATVAATLVLFAPSLTAVPPGGVGGGTVAATSAVYAPSVVGGLATIFPPSLASTSVVRPPSVTVGAVTVVGATLAPTSLLRVPSVTVGPVSVTTVHRASTALVFAPTVTALLTGATIPSGSGLFSPVLLVGQSVTTVHRATTLVLTAPSVTTGPVGVTTVFRATTAVLNPPAVASAVPGTVGAGTIVSLVFLNAPLVQPGAVTLVGATLVPGLAVYPPGITLVPALVVSLPGLGSTLVVFPPSALVRLDGTFIGATAHLNPPSVQTLVGVTLPFLLSTTQTFAPLVAHGLQIVGDTIGSTADLFPPTLETEIWTGALPPPTASGVTVRHVATALAVTSRVSLTGTCSVRQGVASFAISCKALVLSSGVTVTVRSLVTSTDIEGWRA